MAKSTRSQPRPRVIFDVLYGFVPITEWEEKIINSPFFQRLRWIKQLGFSNYIFPGAEHNRFAHAIGVMHSMEQMIRALKLDVPEHELYNARSTNAAAMLHKSLRIAALLHDIGTFPFSHAVEYAYVRHGNDTRRKERRAKDLPNSHEHLGSFIIKNTPYDGGITQILEQYGFDVLLISKIIKGDSPFMIANQLMHSDLDADRMDYLKRDAHYTGLKYGEFDREYILSNLTTFPLGKNQQGFGINKSAMHAIEDFLIARFSWYSQVIRNHGSAKFDVMSTHVAKGLLEKDLIHQFHDLLTMIEKRGERFFWWNDTYFITRCQEVRYKGLIRDPKISELVEMLLYRRAPRTIHHPAFTHRIIQDAKGAHPREKYLNQIGRTVREMESTLKKHGSGEEWILTDIPHKDVIFTSGIGRLKKKGAVNFHQERDPVKIVDREGQISLLIEQENSLMKHLSGFTNFSPSAYANEAAFRLLKSKGLITS